MRYFNETLGHLWFTAILNGRKMILYVFLLYHLSTNVSLMWNVHNKFPIVNRYKIKFTVCTGIFPPCVFNRQLKYICMYVSEYPTCVVIKIYCSFTWCLCFISVWMGCITPGSIPAFGRSSCCDTQVMHSPSLLLLRPLDMINYIPLFSHSPL